MVGELLINYGIFRIKKYYKKYDDLVAVDQLNFSVEKNEFAVLFGSSAAGKTTTLRCIAGLEKTENGEVWFNENNFTDAPIQGREMAMVFQTFALYPHLTTHDNLAYPLIKKKIDNEIIDTLILARDKFPGSSVSLDALCKRYRIDNSKRTQHTALIDCDLLAKVYINLIDQKEPTLNFRSDDTKINQEKNDNINYFKKVVNPTPEELKKHKEYLKIKLKKNFF